MMECWKINNPALFLDRFYKAVFEKYKQLKNTNQDLVDSTYEKRNLIGYSLIALDMLGIRGFLEGEYGIYTDSQMCEQTIRALETAGLLETKGFEEANVAYGAFSKNKPGDKYIFEIKKFALLVNIFDDCICVETAGTFSIAGSPPQYVFFENQEDFENFVQDMEKVLLLHENGILSEDAFVIESMTSYLDKESNSGFFSLLWILHFVNNKSNVPEEIAHISEYYREKYGLSRERCYTDIAKSYLDYVLTLLHSGKSAPTLKRYILDNMEILKARGQNTKVILSDKVTNALNKRVKEHFKSLQKNAKK